MTARRPKSGENPFIESLKGLRIGEPADIGEPVDEMEEARALLHGFTRAGMAQRAPRPTNFDDIYAVAALEMHGKTAENPRSSKSMGAWLYRLKDRGEGNCTPLQGDSEGRHVLVLDAQAVEELREAMTEHRASVASYAQLQEDLAHLRKLRRDGARRGKADR